MREWKGTNHSLQSCHKVEKKNIFLCLSWCARLSGPPLYHPLCVLRSTCQILWKRCSEGSTGCDTLTAAAEITSFICNETTWKNRVITQPTNDFFFFFFQRQRCINLHIKRPLSLRLQQDKYSQTEQLMLQLYIHTLNYSLLWYTALHVHWNKLTHCAV